MKNMIAWSVVTCISLRKMIHTIKSNPTPCCDLHREILLVNFQNRRAKWWTLLVCIASKCFAIISRLTYFARYNTTLSFMSKMEGT